MAKSVKIVLCLLGVFMLVAAAFESDFSRAQTRGVDFKRDIEPIFRANCVGCHGEKKAAGQLRLDAKPLAMKGGINGASIVPGKSGKSRLMQRILGEGGEQRMPLGGEALEPVEIELIKRWIDEGAIWPDADSSQILNLKSGLPTHWAFIAPQRPATPEVKNKALVRTPIDSFILAQIEKEGLTPSPVADKTTLIRRLYLDLVGLPPSPKEVDQFLADASPDAYQKLVERLLASPHYGERWGRWWLDVARYADTNGYEKDRARSIWPYRDWVIKAFNEDKKFDQFTIEQLAGDLVPNATLDQRIATGFLRNSMLNEEGAVDPEQFRVEGLIDRVDAIGKAFLGLTVACAQCHTHKYDPIKHTEYYQFYAFLNSDQEAELEVPDAKVRAKRDETRQAVVKIEDELIAKTPDLEKRMAGWESRQKAPAVQWQVLDVHDVRATFGVKFEHLPDRSLIARGDAATNNVYTAKTKTNLKNITGFRLELMTDASLPHGGPGRRLADGVAAVNEFRVEAAPASDPKATKRLEFARITSDFENRRAPLAGIADGDGKTAWSTETNPFERHQDRKVVFALKQPVSFDSGAELVFQINQKHPEFNVIEFGVHPVVGRFRLSVTASPDPRADPLPAKIRKIADTPAAQRTKEQHRELFSFYRSTVEEWNETNEKIEELLKEWPYGASTLALAPREVPRETHLFKRGDWKRPEEESLTPGTPAFLHPFPAGAPRNRLGLAQWIVDKRNPLTARAIVNRIWQQYFGQGLVATPEDFGTRCEQPSHPALLDWLAIEFRDTGWSFKSIHRLVVNSAVYQQSSRLTPELEASGPYNRWLARAPRLRVEAETVRDIGLAASGLLSRKIGGPSVYPPIPDGVLSLGYGRAMDWPTSKGEDRYRRGMYTFWKRNVPYPAMLAFDAPNGDFACTRRIRSNTPLQALTTLNDTTFMELAQGLALRVWKEGGADDRSKMSYAFKLCTAREPNAFELGKLMALLQDQQTWFKGRTADAVYVSSADLNALPEGIDLHALAPWTMVARVLLNLDETITKE